MQLRLNPTQAHTVERFPVALLVDNVRSLYNVGSMFRTSDAALIQKIILCGFTPTPPRFEIEKTALGAVETVPWEYRKHPKEAVAELRAEGWNVLALEITSHSRNYNELTQDDFPLCIVVGNEIAGLSADVLPMADGAVQIPMYGVKHSLNVAVAAGIMLFSAVAQWKSFATQK